MCLFFLQTVHLKLLLNVVGFGLVCFEAELAISSSASKNSRLSFRADVNMRAEPKGPMFWECFRARVRLLNEKRCWKEKTWRSTNSPRIEIRPEVPNFDIYKLYKQIH